MTFVRSLFVGLLVCVASLTHLRGEELRPITPTKVVRPFNGKDLSGFATFTKATGADDAGDVFQVTDGLIHISGEGAGYLATKQMYRDYHLVVEYKWGEHHTGKYVRNSGVLLHQINDDRVWPTSLEVQLAQGCEGDLILIPGKRIEGQPRPTITSNTRIAEDKKTRFDPEGEPSVYRGRQFWWSNHQPGFKELLDTRGKHDVASDLGEWTKVECICEGDRVTVKINGHTVNVCYDVFPAAGHILLQNEGSEIYFRNLEIRPLKKGTP